ncbi:MAG: maleamate amidohydrolase [Baekduia sp.]|jgi:maleamate amidohydrolase|nr:maleamate amidohydrolase [Baekduia sp.]
MPEHDDLPAWSSWLDPADRRLYELAGYRGAVAPGGRTALLVIDVTRGFVGSRPQPVADAVREHSTSCGERAWSALPHIGLLLGAFRAAGAPVVFTRADRRAQAAIGHATTREPAGERHRDADAFVDGAEPEAGEWVCEKARASAFYGTPLEAYLRSRGVETVAVCGGTTSGCVRASCVDAFSAGFGVLVAEDGCFDRAAQPHLANLFDLHAKYGAVLSAQAIAERLVPC